MSQDNINGPGIPDPLAGGGDFDDDLAKISRPGPKIALVVILVFVLGGIGYWYMGIYTPQKELEQELTQFKVEVQKTHEAGYKTFWDNVQINLAEVNNNQKFEAKITEILGASAVAYSKHLRDKSLPILEKQGPALKKIKAPAGLEPEHKALVNATDELLTAWKNLVSEAETYNDYLTAKEKLEDSGNKWLGVQESPKKEEWRIPAQNYIETVQCILLEDTLVIDIKDPFVLEEKIKDSCYKVKGDPKKSDWFKRVKSDCMPKLLRKEPEISDLYKLTLATFSKAKDKDTASVFGVKECLTRGRASLESQLAEKIFAARINYSKSKNAIIKKADELLTPKK